MTNLKTALLFVLLTGTAFLAYFYTPRINMSEERTVNLATLIPTQFAKWIEIKEPESVEVLNPDLAATIQNIYSQVLSRVYTNEHGEKIMLSIAYTVNQSDNAGKQTHLPEVCYPAQGFKISDRYEIDLTTKFGIVSATRLLASAGQRIEPITYWTTVGDFSANTTMGRKYNQLRYGLHGLIADGLIFRVSNLSHDETISYNLQDEFINDLLSSVSQKNRSQLSVMP